MGHYIRESLIRFEMPGNFFLYWLESRLNCNFELILKGRFFFLV